MSSVSQEVLALRKSGGYHNEADLSVLEINGRDAARFLQARLSNDALALQPGSGQQTCLLDRKANILVIGTLHRLGDSFFLIVDRRQEGETMTLLEEFRFREQVIFHALKRKFLSIDSTKCDLFLLRTTSGTEKLPPAEHSILQTTVAGQAAMLIRRSLSGEAGLLIVHEGDPAAFQTEAQALNMVPVSAEAYAIARLEAGDLGLDLQGLLLPETGLENAAVSYNKGCFPGQEVLARIRTYGAPRRGVAGLIIETAAAKTLTIKRRTAIEVTGAEVGTIHACGYSPTLDKFLALAIIQREFRVPDQTLQVVIAGAPYTVRVAGLPFYSATGKAQQAAELYAKALTEFAGGDEKRAITMLREVIELQPMMADAYESLGVILNRHDQLDEAIALMKQLASLDPRSVMAHANLSVFYMQKDDKEAAEEEKAIAMSIRMSEIARSAAAEEEEAEHRRKLKEAAQGRMEMFREVLKIDPDDFLANAGLGSVYVDLEQYKDAVPCLQKALGKRPTHTVAYLALGEAFEHLGQTSEAVDTYRKGVTVAAQRGDGEPLKKMQIRLLKLGAGAGKQ